MVNDTSLRSPTGTFNSSRWLSTLICLGAVGCGGGESVAGPPGPGVEPPDKAEFNGKADGAAIARWCKKLGEPAFCDICDKAGWYNDGTCETFCQQPDLDCQPIEERLKYGTIGTEAEGIPYWVWQALPHAYPELLPDSGSALDYSRFGFHYEPGRTTPVGFSIQKQFGRPEVVATNCAACHSGTYRVSETAPRQLILGAPAHRADLQRYVRFLQSTAAQSDFVDRVADAIENISDLNAVERVAYRPIVRLTQKGISSLDDRYAWTASRPDWGPGRIDPFNPVKFHQLGLDPSSDTSVGNSDMMSLWNLSPRALHWDGLNSNAREVVLSSAIGTGATAESLPIGQLEGVETWLRGLRAPAYPLEVDEQLAAQGEVSFAQHCADCHKTSGSRSGSVIPLSEVGTDPARLEMWTQQAADRYNAHLEDPALRFSHFRKTEGYVAVPLDGVWLRAPYLHNGSVPTLTDLLSPAAERPTSFWRGYDVLDQSRVGFDSSSSTAQSAGSLFETSLAGNGNGGHEFGTQLPATTRRALVEYLKTL